MGAVHDGNLPSYVVSEAVGIYLPVKLGTADNTVDLATAATHRVIGFSQDLGQTVVGGALKVKASGNTLAVVGAGGWTKGDRLTPTTAGALITTTTAGDFVCAIAQETAAAGVYAEVRMVETGIYSSL